MRNELEDFCRALSCCAVIASNIEWQWTPNNYLAAILAFVAALLVTVALSGIGFTTFGRPPSYHPEWQPAWLSHSRPVITRVSEPPKLPSRALIEKQPR
jgi:hypothetical protein